VLKGSKDFDLLLFFLNFVSFDGTIHAYSYFAIFVANNKILERRASPTHQYSTLSAVMLSFEYSKRLYTNLALIKSFIRSPFDWLDICAKKVAFIREIKWRCLVWPIRVFKGISEF
jgi:hypothetical protein